MTRDVVATGDTVVPLTGPLCYERFHQVGDAVLRLRWARKTLGARVEEGTHPINLRLGLAQHCMFDPAQGARSAMEPWLIIQDEMNFVVIQEMETTWVDVEADPELFVLAIDHTIKRLEQVLEDNLQVATN